MNRMKRMFWLLCLVIGADRISAQTTVGFNFSYNPSTVSGWVNLHGDPSLGVISATDATTGISLSSVLAANWFNNGDVSAEDGVGVYPASYFPWPVMGSMWLQQGGTQAQFNAAIPQLEISGLNVDSVYYIRMTSSYIYGADGDPTQYTVSGLTMAPSQYLNLQGNLTTGITFQNVHPDASGKIRVYVNTTSTTDLAAISGLQVISGSAQIGLPNVHITSPANGDILAEESNIVINATATETGSTITKVEFFADTIKLGEADAAPYTFTWVNPNEGHYMITARATDGSGTTNTASINISVESLTSFWSMTGNIGMNADSNFVGNVDSVRLAFRTKNLERMSISPTGNVGIGVIAPTAQLHTTGTVRLAGLKNDSTNTQPRMIVADTSGNLYYRSIGAGGIGGASSDTFSANRFQYLNGHLYSIGGSVNDPVNHPAFRVYNNGDLAAGTTMDTSVNTNDQTGFRYFAKQGYLEIGASDRIDTTQSPIVYGHWPSSGIIINSDDANIIKGKLMNTVFTCDLCIVDSLTRFENAYVGGEQLHFIGAGNSYIRSFIGGQANQLAGSVNTSMIYSQGLHTSKPVNMDMIIGYEQQTLDTSFLSLISGTRIQFGGIGQLTSGQFLINRSPYGTVLGNANVDFSSLPTTGLQGTAVANIGSYPLFVLANSAENGNSGLNSTTTAHSNAMTVLYNGRTQINTTGLNADLAQAAVTPKAALDVVSTNTGVLLPRLTNAQRNAIVTGDLQNGLLLYNTDSSVFQYYNGSAWNSVGSGAGSGGSGRWQFAGGTVFDSTDNVGIGTSDTKGYKLAVNGNAIFTKIKVRTFGLWPDYVFGPDYHLPSLPELEKYIRAHQHLPDLPAATEVDKDGQDIGANQQLLLKKVEELTLYVIDLNKKVEALSRENEKLKNQHKKAGR